MLWQKIEYNLHIEPNKAFDSVFEKIVYIPKKN